MLYFAYGSNMCAELLAERLAREGHVFADRRYATAYGYTLTFDKRSTFEPDVGYANIRAESGTWVEGTLNELSDEALALLDRIELVPVQYRREIIRVHDSRTEAVVDAWAYLAQPDVIDTTTRPTRQYLERLMAASDMLSPAYLRTLAAVECHS